MLRTSPTAWSSSGLTIPTPTLQTPAVQGTVRWDSPWPVSNTLPSTFSNLVRAETPPCPDVPQTQPSSAASAPACLPCLHQHRAWAEDLQSATHKARTHIICRDPAGNTHRTERSSWEETRAKEEQSGGHVLKPHPPQSVVPSGITAARLGHKRSNWGVRTGKMTF